jgi:hypothetical protein
MSARLSSLRIALFAVAVTAASLADAAAIPAKAEDGKPYIGGAWLVEKPASELKTVDGKAPPLKPEAAAKYAQRKQAGKKADPVAVCLPNGVPRLLNANKPIYILQKPKQVTVMYQENHQARLLYLNQPVPKGDDAPDPTYNGTSVARWQGNTLVVDTVGFNDTTWLDDSGLPHSDQLSVVERYDLVSPDRLRVNITITDPATFTAPWQTQVMYKRQPDMLGLKEDPCAEKLWTPPSSTGAG